MNKEIVAQQANPQGLLAMAVEKGAGIEQLKELMDLQERWEKKEARKAFFDALSTFQSKVPELKKNKTARINSAKGSFSYNYADLGGITKSIKGLLTECGLAYRWEFEEKDKIMKVTCHISHRDGHTETSCMEAGMDNSGSKNDIQQKGSTQTYLQRYTLIGALGLSTADEDNDGRNRPPQQQPKNMSEEDVLDMWKDQVNDCKTQIALTQLYMKNRKTVDSEKKIQQIFKDREGVLKKESQPEKVNMP